MEDTNNQTQLFYRLYYYSQNPPPYGDSRSNSIYRFDPEYKGMILLFLSDEFWEGHGTSINDYEFWNSNFNKYIYAATEYDTEGSPAVFIYNKPEPFFKPQMWGTSIEY